MCKTQLHLNFLIKYHSQTLVEAQALQTVIVQAIFYPLVMLDFRKNYILSHGFTIIHCGMSAMMQISLNAIFFFLKEKMFNEGGCH